MAAAKKLRRPNKGAQPLTAHAFGTFVAEVRGQFKAFDAALTNLRDHMDQQFARVDRRFEEVDKRFEQIDKRFDQVDRRFEELDKRFDVVDADIGRLQDAAREHGRQLHVVQRTLQSKVDRDEVQ